MGGAGAGRDEHTQAFGDCATARCGRRSQRGRSLQRVCLLQLPSDDRYPRPGENGGVLPLHNHFGLHPTLAPIMPFWEQKTLAFVHASGSPDSSRSHFDAQDYMETATPSAKRTPDGWLNRLLEVLPGTRSSTDGVSIGPTLPRIMSGKVATTNFSLNPAGTRPTPLDRPKIQSAFDRLYTSSDPLSVGYREGQSARKALLAKLTAEMLMSDQGAPSAVGFTAQAQKLGRLIAKDPNLKVAFVAFGGWDTHINQGSSTGQLANRLRGLGESLAALIKGLDSSYSDTAVIVMSESGGWLTRTATPAPTTVMGT